MEPGDIAFMDSESPLLTCFKVGGTAYTCYLGQYRAIHNPLTDQEVTLLPPYTKVTIII